MFRVGQTSLNPERVAAGKKAGIDASTENGCTDPLPATVENFMSVNVIRYVRLVTEAEARFTESETRFSFSFTWCGIGIVLIRFRI